MCYWCVRIGHIGLVVITGTTTPVPHHWVETLPLIDFHLLSTRLSNECSALAKMGWCQGSSPINSHQDPWCLIGRCSKDGRRSWWESPVKMPDLAWAEADVSSIGHNLGQFWSIIALLQGSMMQLDQECVIYHVGRKLKERLLTVDLYPTLNYITISYKLVIKITITHCYWKRSRMM